MKKKACAVLLAAAVATASLAAACGSPADSSAGNGKDSEGSAESLTVWCWDPAFNLNAMQKAEEIYKKDHPEFELNIVETPWNDVQTKLTTAVSSGKLDSLPDILLMQDNAFQKNVLSYPDAFLDLTGSSIDFSKFAEAKKEYSMVEGKNYGVPFDNGAVIGCYRTDILKDAGFTIDDFTDITWEEYIALGKDVLAKTGKPLLSCIGSESDVIVMILQSAGSSLFDEAGNPYIAKNETVKATVEVYKELVESGVMVEVNDYDQYIGSMNNETVAGTINGCWIMSAIQTAEDQSGKWAVTNMPRLSGTDSATNYSSNGGSSWAVCADSSKADLATDFLGSTFGASVEFWENVLPSGALSTYLPAAESSKYAEPSEFFSGEPVFKKITEYASKIPSIHTGVYYYEARDAVATAIRNVIGGADIQAELQTAEDTVNFAMGR